MSKQTKNTSKRQGKKEKQSQNMDIITLKSDKKTKSKRAQLGGNYCSDVC